MKTLADYHAKLKSYSSLLVDLKLSSLQKKQDKSIKVRDLIIQISSMKILSKKIVFSKKLL